MQTVTACATMWTTASAAIMSAVSATDPAPSMIAGAAGLPPGTVIVMVTNSDALGVCGGSCGADVDEDGLCDDVDDCVGSYDESAASATDPAPSTTAGATGFPPETAIVTATSSTPLASAVETAPLTWTTASVTTWTTASAAMTSVICNGPGAIYDCGCNDIPAEDCDCTNQLDALGVCVEIRLPTLTVTESVTATKSRCTNAAACTNPSATDDDGSCLMLTTCGICGGPVPSTIAGATTFPRRLRLRWQRI